MGVSRRQLGEYKSDRTRVDVAETVTRVLVIICPADDVQKTCLWLHTCQSRDSQCSLYIHHVRGHDSSNSSRTIAQVNSISLH